MTKAQIIETILKSEKEAWTSYNEAKVHAEDGRFGAAALEVEKTARARWATLYKLTEDLKIA